MEKNKLKILLINRWLGYNEGGNETHMKDLIIWFTKKGHRVSVITTEGDTLKDLTNVKKYYLKSAKGYYSYGSFGVIFAAIFNIKAFLKFLYIWHIKKEKFDVMSIHFSLEAVLARAINFIYGVPYVMVMAGDTPLELIEGKRADGKISISHFMNEQCIKYGYSSEVIPKGFDLSRFRLDIDTTELYEKYKLSGEAKKLLVVCRLDPRKNLITLIEAMNLVVHEYKVNIKLFIVGDGVERDYLESKVKEYKLEENIFFVGAVPNTSDLLPKYYAFSDLFVLPTLYEGFGWVYLEAMAAGLPILTTNVGSNPEIVGAIGELIEPQNPKILADTIVNLLNDGKKLEEMANDGLKNAQKFSWKNLIKDYEQYYTDISLIQTQKLSYKLKRIGWIVIDFFFILRHLLKGVVFNKITNEGGAWKKEGQVGSIR